MKITEIYVIDEVFLEAYIDADDMHEGLVVSAEFFRPDMRLHFDDARWSRSGEDALGFLASNFEEIRDLISSELKPLSAPLR